MANKEHKTPEKIDKALMGFVFNPKNGEILAVQLDGKNDAFASVISVCGREVGSGYFDQFGDMASRETKLPRAHTPSGVNVRGGGTGAALYTAMALTAHVVNAGVAEMPVRVSAKGDGISSYNCDEKSGRYWSRSKDADLWWLNANSKHCMTKRSVRKKVHGFTSCDIDAYYYDTAKQLGLVLMEATELIDMSSLRDPASLVGKLAIPSRASAKNIINANWGLMSNLCVADNDVGLLIDLFASALISQKLATKSDVSKMRSSLKDGVDRPPPKPKKRVCRGARVRSFDALPKVRASK